MYGSQRRETHGPAAKSPLGNAVSTGTTPAHDKDMAAQFLACLDPDADRFTFQFFSDGLDEYAEIFHGTLDQAWPKLLAMNTPEHRIGVFVTISETDLRGRRTENIVRPRAHFVDADTPEQITNCIQGIESCGATPSMIVKSGRGIHIYWFSSDVPRDQFVAFQKDLISKLGTDTAISDLPRVMRLPGTLHLKDVTQPRLVRLCSLNSPPRRWKFSELVAKFAASPAAATAPASNRASRNNVVSFKLPEWAINYRPPAVLAHLPIESLAIGLEPNLKEIRAAVTAIPPSAIATEPEWMRLARALAHEAAVHRSYTEQLWDILDAASRGAPGYNQEENRNRFQRYISEALNRSNPITIATVFHMALEHGWQGCAPPGTLSAPEPDNEGACRKLPNRVSLDDFYAYMPMHNYIFAPSREPWPGSSVDARLGAIPLVDADGKALLDEKGKQIKISASLWLDRNRPVEQMTWAPGLPMVIRDRLISEGGWIERRQVSCFNLYRPPTIEPGNAVEAERWLDHVRKVFGADADHIVKWLAHRVQRPQEKINHALVFGGSQGIGKDTLLEPVKHAVGPWNFSEVSPQHMLGRFNGFLKSVILRVNEARDLGEINRFSFYDHMKAYTAAPPDVLRVDEKNLREYSILNCCGVIITTNHKADGIYLPADDRRHFVAWSDLKKEDFVDGYWNKLWGWYARGGDRHVAAYLAQLDISSFDQKHRPPRPRLFGILSTPTGRRRMRNSLTYSTR